MPGTIKISIPQKECMIIEVFSNYTGIKDKNVDYCLVAFLASLGSDPTTALPMFTTPDKKSIIVQRHSYCLLRLPCPKLATVGQMAKEIKV